jgi:hypothetical protein
MLMMIRNRHDGACVRARLSFPPDKHRKMVRLIIAILTMCLIAADATTQERPGPKQPQATPQGAQWGPPIIPPELVPRIPRPSAYSLGVSATSEYLSDSQKARIEESYRNQFRPQILEGPGGVRIAVDPNDPRHQWQLPPAPLPEKFQAGDVHGTTYVGSYIGRDGQLHYKRMIPEEEDAPAPTAGPRSDATPSPMPAAAPPPLSVGGVGTASAGPSGAPPPGPLGTAPPAAPGQISTGSRYFDNLIAISRQMKFQDAMDKAVAEGNAKWHEKLMTQAPKIDTALESIPIMRKLVSNPYFKPGWRNAVLAVQRTLVQLGLAKPELAAPGEQFEKFLKDLNLDDLTVKLAGTGQIRVFEGNLVSGANANINNSKTAINFLLDAKERVLKRDQWIEQQVSQYAADYGGVTPALQAWASKQYASKLYTQDQMNNWRAQFKAEGINIDPETPQNSKDWKKGSVPQEQEQRLPKGHTPETLQRVLDLRERMRQQ